MSNLIQWLLAGHIAGVLYLVLMLWTVAIVGLASLSWRRNGGKK